MQRGILGSYYIRDLLLRGWSYLLYYGKDFTSRLASLFGNVLKGLIFRQGLNPAELRIASGRQDLFWLGARADGSDNG